MKRTKPLRSRKPLPRRRLTQRRSGRVHDAGYLAAVRALPCLLRGDECAGRVEADHAGERPLGRKASDDTAIPLCAQHHWERTNYTGAFRGFTAWSMRMWCTSAVIETQARIGRREAA